MVWADAEQWRALDACTGALDDPAIRNRLHHIHLVQRAFHWMVSQDGSPFPMSSPADYPTVSALRAYGEQASTSLTRLIEEAGDELLTRRVDVPYFKNPPLVLSGHEALTQAVMHTQWHRGQNSARLRELGAEPPTIDYIIWMWKGRPAAAW